jgi:PhnB protein
LASISTYLNFARETEAAFAFYREVFGTDYLAPIARFGDVPWDHAPLADEDRNLVMNVQLPILGGHVLMGSDAPASLGHAITIGNNFHISLNPDTREDGDRLFAALADGGTIGMPMTDMFWGSYWGTVTDRFGVQWMIDCASRA